MNIIFDLDGTLTDPKVGIIACINYALAKLAIEINEDIVLEKFIGPPLFDTFQTLCGDDLIAKKAIGFYRERFAIQGLYENCVYEGIPECLHQLSAQSDSMYVATSKPTVYAKRIINHFDLNKYFNCIYGSNLDGSLSDKTDLLRHIIQREGLSPEATIMIGDRSFDVVAAKNHGIPCLGVLWGYGSIAELVKAGVDLTCSHPEQIYAHLFS